MIEAILLVDAEIAVAGGAIAQSISISATQRNTSVISQTTTAIKSGGVTVTAPPPPTPSW